MQNLKPKKYFGQHFLKDEEIAETIVNSFLEKNPCKEVLEVGPGMGVLTKYLLEQKNLNVSVIEIDRDAVVYLENQFPNLKERIISADFLQFNPDDYFKEPFSIIGNFPYNISSQILFMVLENRDKVPFVLGMFQKEVGARIASPPGSKVYGILSVFMQTFFEVEYLFQVDKSAFNPPPQIQSAVLRFTKKENAKLNCDETFFFKVVKTAFNQRRKTLRNALKSIYNINVQTVNVEIPYLDLRAERLSWQMFEELTIAIEHWIEKNKA